MAMTMNGEVQLAASREAVWAKLNDPEVLKACIPGCEELEKTEDNGFRATAKMKVGPVSAAVLAPRLARTAVGQRRDGSIVLVAADGGQIGYSVGLTNYELAQELVRLGCVTASGLEPGNSTTMAFDGQLLNRPSDPGGERAISEGLLVSYSGVYAPAPSEPVPERITPTEFPPMSRASEIRNASIGL